MESLRRDAARSRERIVDAARTLTMGGETLALNAVARAADVGVGTVYRHFATIAELEEALVWQQFEALAEILHFAEPDELERVFSDYLMLLMQDPLFERVTARATPALPQTSLLRDSLITSLGELMTRAMASGHLRPDVSASDVVLLLCGIAHSARAAQAAPQSPQSRLLLQVLLDGLRPPMLGATDLTE
jgi:AcrR family transcriptional regulator